MKEIGRRYGRAAMAGLLGLAACWGCSGDKALRENFKNPPLTHRMNVNQHHLPMDSVRLAEYLAFLRENGYRGMATNVSQREYLDNPAFFEAFRQGVRTAKGEGFDVWLYDEKLYPSGMADTKVLDAHPNGEAEGLLFHTSTVRGGETAVVRMPGRLVTAQAVPLLAGKPAFQGSRDIGSGFKNNELRWDTPEGEWNIVLVTRDALYEDYQAGTERGGEYPRYPSLLLPEITETFIDATHRRYAEAFGEKLGNYFTANFTDEPSSMALPFRRLGYGVYPWKENVSVEFRNRYGMVMEDQLIRLALDDGPEGQKLRYRYFRIIAELMSTNYFGALKTYCHSQNLPSSGHLLLEESIVAHVPLYGDIMACYRQMDIPGIDVLTGIPSKTRTHLFSSRLASSAAELSGGFRVMYESCPIDNDLPGHTEPPALEVKAVHNRVMLGGITDFNNYLQLAHETPEGRTAFNQYTARVVSMLYGGHRAARIAVYYPIETVWTQFRPADMHLGSWWNVEGAAPEAQRIEDILLSTTYTLFDHGWEFSYLDAQGLAEGRVEKSTLRYGNDLQWDVLVLPAVETLPREAFERVLEFARTDGTVIAVGNVPVNTEEEFPCHALASEFRTLIAKGRILFLPQPDTGLSALLEEKITRPIHFDDPDGLLHAHRKVGGHDVFFVINDTNTDRTTGIRLPSGKKWNIWDPQTGEVTPAAPETRYRFGPYDGLIIRQQ